MVPQYDLWKEGSFRKLEFNVEADAMKALLSVLENKITIYNQLRSSFFAACLFLRKKASFQMGNYVSCTVDLMQFRKLNVMLQFDTFILCLLFLAFEQSLFLQT